MKSQHFRMRSELSGAIAKRPPHAKNQLSVPGSFFYQFVIYTNIAGAMDFRVVRLKDTTIEKWSG